MKRKNKLDSKLNKELFDTSKFERIFELSPIWFELLSNLENNFLKELLEDVNFITGEDFKPVRLRINFKTNSSYNLFKLSMINDDSRKIIEKIFKATFGEDVTVSIKRPYS